MMNQADSIAEKCAIGVALQEAKLRGAILAPEGRKDQAREDTKQGTHTYASTPAPTPSRKRPKANTRKQLKHNQSATTRPHHKETAA